MCPSLGSARSARAKPLNFADADEREPQRRTEDAEGGSQRSSLLGKPHFREGDGMQPW
jgi:hypothetical protein